MEIANKSLHLQVTMVVTTDQVFKSLQLTISNFSVPSLLLFSLASSSSPLSSSASSPSPSSSTFSSSLPSPSPSLAPSPSSMKLWVHMVQEIRLSQNRLLKEESVVSEGTTMTSTIFFYKYHSDGLL